MTSGRGPWTLVYDGFDPADEGTREALCALGNGYMVCRAAAPESQWDDVHYPGTYIAGLYNRATSHVGGRRVEAESLVNEPNWLSLRFRLDEGRWFQLSEVHLLEYQQVLDMRRGVLQRRVRFEDPAGRRATVTTRHLVHLEHVHLMALSATIEPDGGPTRVTVRSVIDGRVRNTNVERYRPLESKHLDIVDADVCGVGGAWLRARTTQSRVEVAMAARTGLYLDGEGVAVERRAIRDEHDEQVIGWELSCDIGPGEALGVEKIASLWSGRDAACSEPLLEAVKDISDAPRFDSLLMSHTRAWAHLWRRLDAEVLGDEAATRALRLHLFHVAQTVGPGDLGRDTGVPARGWHGEAYRGDIFWDELFVLPTLNLRLPEVSRSALLYRYRRLPEARRAAREAGLPGAMFPWRSGSNGREETAPLRLNPLTGRWVEDHSYLQRHIGAAIAYNTWHYVEATEDEAFLEMYGGDLILEIALFFSHLASWNAASKRWEIRGVMGPDEFHDGYPGRERRGIDNNAYTNVMAVWVLERALHLLARLPAQTARRIREDLSLDDEEVARWRSITRRMFVPFHGGVISQFEGYEELEEIDWQAALARHQGEERLDNILDAEGRDVRAYQVSKQADVLMLFYLFTGEELEAMLARLGYAFDDEHVSRTIEYYASRTSHDSTLSRLVHAWVLARRERRGSWGLFEATLRSDLSDIQGGTTREGIHLGAMAGSVDLLQRGYTGLGLEEGRLRFEPRLPEHTAGMRMRIRRGRAWLEVEVLEDALFLTLDKDAREGLRVRVGEAEEALRPGVRRRFEL